MGADLIINTLAVEKDRPLDWSQVDTALATMTDAEIEKKLAEAGVFEDDTEDPRQEVRDIFARLKEIIEDLPRDTSYITVRGLRLYQSGGMSWGDSPTESGDVMYQAIWFESILQAVGFDVDWWLEMP